MGDGSNSGRSPADARAMSAGEKAVSAGEKAASAGEKTTRLRTFAWRSIRGAAVAFAACGALELGLILGDFSYPALDAPIVVTLPDGWMDGGGIHARDPGCLWVPGPGASIPWGDDEHVNADGYRGPPIPRERTGDALRIATLGDSSTFGFGVAYADCYSAQLARLMTERTGRAVEILDAGVIGYTVRQGLERWRKLVRDYHPDVVIAAFGAVNEHVACMGLSDDALIRGQALNVDPFVQWTRRLRRDLRLTHVAAYAADALRGGRIEIQRRRRESELAVRPSLASLGAVDWPGTRRVSVEDFGVDMRTLRDEVVAAGARFVALSMPRRITEETMRPVLLEYTRKLASLAESGAFELVDGRAALGRAIQADVWPRDLMVDDFHPSPLGHAALAKALADALAAR